MLNHKHEKLFAILIFISLVCFFSLFIPQEIDSLLFDCLFLFFNILLVFIIFYLYKTISIKSMSKKINHLVYQNELEKATKYVDGLLKKQPNLLMLKIKKLELLVLIGNISDYQSVAMEIPYNETNYDFLVMIGNIVRFFRQEQIITIDFDNTKISKSTLMWKINYLLCNKDSLSHEQMISLSQEISTASVDMYRCIIFTILYLFYKKDGDEINQRMYGEKAIKTSPSLEVTQYIDLLFTNENI